MKLIPFGILIILLGCAVKKDDYDKQQAEFWHKQSDYWQSKATQTLDLGERCVKVGEQWKDRALACEKGAKR